MGLLLGTNAAPTHAAGASLQPYSDRQTKRIGSPAQTIETPVVSA